MRVQQGEAVPKPVGDAVSLGALASSAGVSEASQKKKRKRKKKKTSSSERSHIQQGGNSSALGDFSFDDTASSLPHPVLPPEAPAAS